MNAFKNKPGALWKKEKPIVKITHSHSLSFSKKINGTAKHKAENASPKEFFLLKDISGFNNENLAMLLGTTHRTIHNKKNSPLIILKGYFHVIYPANCTFF